MARACRHISLCFWYHVWRHFIRLNFYFVRSCNPRVRVSKQVVLLRQKNTQENSLPRSRQYLRLEAGGDSNRKWGEEFHANQEWMSVTCGKRHTDASLALRRGFSLWKMDNLIFKLKLFFEIGLSNKAFRPKCCSSDVVRRTRPQKGDRRQSCLYCFKLARPLSTRLFLFFFLLFILDGWQRLDRNGIYWFAQFTKKPRWRLYNGLLTTKWRALRPEGKGEWTSFTGKGKTCIYLTAIILLVCMAFNFRKGEIGWPQEFKLSY